MKSMPIIEGSVTVGRLFAQIFQNRGWRVSTCNHADCAMDRLAGSAPYDVVLLSYRVPGADGVKLVRFIRALELRVTAAVVMVTGTSGVAEQARAAGADDVLLKPV
jgi:CheY-like chemotaxis protein